MPTINGKACVVNGTPVDKVFSNGKQLYSRNLISGSYDSTWGYSSNSKNATIQKVTTDSGEGALHIISTDSASGLWCHPNLPISESYTLSVEIKGTGVANRLGWEGLSDNIAYPTSDWKRVSSTASINIKNWYAFVFYGKMDVYFRFLKIEKGSVATPWTPAPEDVGITS